MASSPPVPDAIASLQGNLEARLLLATTHVFGVTADQLRSQARGDVSEPRWALSYVLTETCGWSCLKVAKFLNKDHTAILYGVRRAKALLRSSEPFFEAVRMIEEAI